MTSNCPNPDICGSCSWSSMPYDQQVLEKLNAINSCFAENALDVVVDTIHPSPAIEHYRNRMDFVINFEGRFGLREKGKWWKVIDGHTCFISDQRIEELFHKIFSWLKECELSFYDRKKYHGFLRYAVIRCSKLGESMVTIVTSTPESSDEESRAIASLELLAEKLNCTTLIWSINETQSDVSYGDVQKPITGEGFIREKIGDSIYKITPNAFFQTNSHAAEILQDTVLSFCGEINNPIVLDLFCGSGFFSIALAKRFPQTKIVGIELSQDAINDAAANNLLNETAVDYLAIETENSDWAKYNAELVLLDPPRAGLHKKVLKQIFESRPSEIIYVSCNFKNFIRELKSLQEIYALEDSVAIDMFPHTPHVELVSKLVRKVS